MLRALAAVAVTCLTSVAAAADLPRYKLAPGRVLEYKSESTFKYGKDKSAAEDRTSGETTVWVLRTNPDGTAHVVTRAVSRFSQKGGDGEWYTQPPQTELSVADVGPDGRVVPGAGATVRSRGPVAFPRLPKDAAEAKAGWTSTRDDDAVTAAPAGENTFTVITVGVMDKGYLAARKATVTFDPARGVVTKVASENSQGHGFYGKGAGTTELVSEKTLPAAELATLAADADRHFAATKGYGDAVSAAQKLPAAAAGAALAKAGAKAGAALKAAAEVVTQADLKAALTDSVKGHDRSAKYTLEAIERKAEVVGKPAAAVDATDMDGKAVALADLKGKVVVLDFWYRGCGWCVKAMPQMNQLTADFAGEKVAVLGMNTDAVKKDVEFVIDVMKLKYRTLRVGRDAPEEFGVQTFPTLVLIDKKGVVRDLHVGYTPTLREDVGKAVRALLAQAD